MANDSVTLANSPPTPVTIDLIRALRAILATSVFDDLDREELYKLELAFGETEREVFLLNDRLQTITKQLMDAELKGGIVAASDLTTVVTASGVTSLRANGPPVNGALRLAGMVEQVGTTFNIIPSHGIVLEVPSGTVNGVNDTFSVAREVDWLVVLKGGRATTNGNDWTLQPDNKTFKFDLGEPVPAFGGSPPAGEVLLALSAVKV
jgi:hypothetical protein